MSPTMGEDSTQTRKNIKRHKIMVPKIAVPPGDEGVGVGMGGGLDKRRGVGVQTNQTRDQDGQAHQCRHIQHI